MPNTGKPSRDCHLCRQRRVKCDLARPSCQRCIKYGKACPGYRDEQDLVFRHTRPDAPKRAKGVQQGARKQGAREASAKSTPGLASQSGGGALELALRGVTPPSTTTSGASTPNWFYTIKEPWTLHSIPLLLMCYDPVGFLGRVYQNIPRQDDALVFATHLWARTYLASRFHAPQDPRETELCLSQALSSVASAIQDPRRATTDTTILAVWLLGMYELQIGGITGGDNAVTAWSVHSKGLSSLLRARGAEQFYTTHGRSIFWCVFTIVQINCIITAVECPPESDMWLDTIASIGDPDDTLLIFISRYINRACKIFPAISPLLVEGRYAEACAVWPRIVQEIDALEEIMSGWMAPATPAERDPGPVSDYFWNTWRSARIKLHNITILLSNIIQYGPVPSPVDHSVLQRRRQLAYVLIATTAQDILDSVPISLGGMAREFTSDPHAAWFEGMRLIWPLTNLYTVRSVPRDLRLVAKAALISIGEERGILQALKSQPGQMPYVPEALIGIRIDEVLEAPHTPRTPTPGLPG